MMCQSKFFANQKVAEDKARPRKDSTARRKSIKLPGLAKLSARLEQIWALCYRSMARLGQFVKRWGTHFVDSEFWWEMEVQVQLNKTRPPGSASASGIMGGARGVRAFGALREATDTSRRTIRRLADDATSAAFLEPQLPALQLQ